MELINFLFGTAKRSLPADTADFWYRPVTSSWIQSGHHFDEKTALGIVAVYACVRVIAESIASLPLVLYRRLPNGGKEREASTPLQNLLTFQPNPWQTRFGFWEMLMGHVLLRGNAFARKVRNARGDIVLLQPLDPTRMKIAQDSSGAVTYEYRLRTGGAVEFTQRDMFHLQGLSCDGLVGLSPLELLANALGYAMAADEYGTAFFQNYAQLGIVLKHPATLGKEAKENLKQSINEAHAGQRRAFTTMVLEEGMTWDQIGMSWKDTQIDAVRKGNVSEIARAFRIPPHMIGDLERATFSNIEQQSIDFVVNSLRPWAVRVEQTIWRDLVESEKDVLYAEFLLDALLRGDLASRSEAYVKALNNGWLNADEVRELENRNPIPDGSGQVYRVPLNTVPSNSLAATNPQLVKPAQPAPQKASKDGRILARERFETEYARAVRRELKETPAQKTKRAFYLEESFEQTLAAVGCVLRDRGFMPTEELDHAKRFFSATDLELTREWEALPVEKRADLEAFKIPAMWAKLVSYFDSLLDL